MPRGGPQPGSGRKPGSKNAATIERELRARAGVQAAIEGGLMPLDVLMAVMRGEKLPNGKEPTDRQIAAARDAAPYIHPRLASTDTTVKSDNVHRHISDAPTEAGWLDAHGTPANDAVTTALPDDDVAAG